MSSEYQTIYQGLLEHLEHQGLYLDYLHLDLPINLITQQNNNVSAETVKNVRDFVTDTLNWRFGWILTDRSGGQQSSAAFAESVSKGLSHYLSLAGTANDYVLSAWFPHPQYTVPDDYTTEMPAFATFRMMDQILNVSGDGNGKQCTFEILGENSNTQTFQYVNYNHIQSASVLFRLYCDKDQSISLAEGSSAKPTVAIYQCRDEGTERPYFSNHSDCDQSAQIVGYLFPQHYPGTTPLYQCNSVSDNNQTDCQISAPASNQSDTELLGYY